MRCSRQGSSTHVVLGGGMEWKQQDAAKKPCQIQRQSQAVTAEIEASHNTMWDLLNWE